MADLNPVVWPPEPIKTARLVLRAHESRDRAAFIDLLASPEVGTYLGGPQPRDKLELEVPGPPAQHPGLFAAERAGSMIGQIILRRADGPRAAGTLELGYMFLPQTWGSGYATEACAAALTWLTAEFPGEPVVLFTQTANSASMRLAAKLGFTEVERFEAWDAEQWYGQRPPAAPPS